MNNKAQLKTILIQPILADRTNGRAYATVLRLSVCRLFVTLCIVAKRCILEQKLLLRAYRKSYMRNRLVPKWMTLTFCLAVISRSRQPLRYIRRWISRKPLKRLIGSKGPPIGNGMWAIEWSRDRCRHVTLKGQTRDPNSLKAQYLENYLS